MREFKGTKGKWELTDRKRGIEVLIKQSTYKSICTTTGNTKWQYDMLLISKAPLLLDEHIKDLAFLELIAKQLDELGGYLESDVYDRINEKKKLIKQATEL